MKVKCTKLIDEQSEEVIKNSSWLTVSKEYHVLSINIQYGSSVKFQVISDNGTPAFHNANQFKIVSDLIPDNWVVDFDSDGFLKFEPKEWKASEFWEQYFDGEPEAVQLFNFVKEELQSLEP